MSAPRKKTAKKTAKKAAKKTKVVAAWEEECQPFFAATRERFDFLVEEHGFSPATLLVTPPECLVRYAKPGGGVDILSDRLEPPWVVVTGGDPPVRVGLHELVALLDPTYNDGAPETTEALLDHHAAFLRAHARAVLGGDPALFARVLARRAAPA